MLFLTVYGPELESLFGYIHKYSRLKGSISLDQIYSAYLPSLTLAQRGRAKNIDDAVNYLKAAQLIRGNGEYTSLVSEADAGFSFAALLLRQFRNIEQNAQQVPLIDLLYITILEQLYIIPNCSWIGDVHTAVNQLDLACQLGGVSQEKVGAWKRVMEFLGLGYRMGSGFYCLYSPALLKGIVGQWGVTEGSLQVFFEEYLTRWVPCLTAQGDVASPVGHPMKRLLADGHLHLSTKQDSPSKPYFGHERLRGIEIG